ncbi:MAG TPA: WbqC family protein [Longimicrobiales bacterium]|nr:WbqC family protein [Longimicrobiales bacterium]
MILAQHQPAYLPWLGLLHKVSVADVFVIMDDVQYLKREFQNRNRVKTGQGQAAWLTVPVDLRASESRRICDIRIKRPDPGERPWYVRHWATLRTSYANAPHFGEYAGFFEHVLLGQRWERLVDLNLAILHQAFEWFGITTRTVLATTVGFTGRKSDLILEQAARLDADMVFAGELGRNYIDVPAFSRSGVRVVFQEYRHPEYPQLFGGFVSRMSFVDLLFNCGPDAARIAFSGNVSREELWSSRSTG